jgi:hypothetical protein
MALEFDGSGIRIELFQGWKQKKPVQHVEQVFFILQIKIA